MKKIIALLFAVFVFVPSVYAKPVEIPEVNGDYQDPENIHQRVRVFVDKVKDTSVESLVCVDNGSDAVVGPTGWKLPGNVVYKLNLSTVPSGVGSANWTLISEKSFAVWSLATNGAINFTRGADTRANKQAGDGQNILAWGRTNGNALAVTYTRYNTITKQVVDVDTIMNQKFAWTWADNACGVVNTYDAQNILTHELGHWMGLNDHYTAGYVENTMYGYGAKAETKKNTLTNGDVVGVKSLYE